MSLANAVKDLADSINCLNDLLGVGSRVIKLSNELNAACEQSKQSNSSSTVVSRINGANSIQCQGLEVAVPLSDSGDAGGGGGGSGGGGEGKETLSLPLVSNLTTEIYAGEHTVVVGPNGTGKTSTFF